MSQSRPQGDLFVGTITAAERERWQLQATYSDRLEIRAMPNGTPQAFYGVYASSVAWVSGLREAIASLRRTRV